MLVQQAVTQEYGIIEDFIKKILLHFTKKLWVLGILAKFLT